MTPSIPRLTLSPRRWLHWMSALVFPTLLFLGSDGQRCAAQTNGAAVVGQPEKEINVLRAKARNYFKTNDF